MAKESKIVDISFSPEKIGCSIDTDKVFGIAVKKDGKKLSGKCDERIKKSLVDAGKCEK